MRKTLSLLLAAVMCTFCLTGCVKIIDKGTEGEYTGEVAFDAAADSSSDWEQVVAEITEKAVDLKEQLDGDGLSKAAAVSVNAPVKEFESKANGKKNALILDVKESTERSKYRSVRSIPAPRCVTSRQSRVLKASPIRPNGHSTQKH